MIVDAHPSRQNSSLGQSAPYTLRLPAISQLNIALNPLPHGLRLRLQRPLVLLRPLPALLGLLHFRHVRGHRMCRCLDGALGAAVALNRIVERGDQRPQHLLCLGLPELGIEMRRLRGAVLGAWCWGSAEREMLGFIGEGDRSGKGLRFFDRLLVWVCGWAHVLVRGQRIRPVCLAF